jgi:hypothetical protein
MRTAIVLSSLLLPAAVQDETPPFQARNAKEAAERLHWMEKDILPNLLHKWLTHLQDGRTANWERDPLDPTKKVPSHSLRQQIYHAQEEIRRLRAALNTKPPGKAPAPGRQNP